MANMDLTPGELKILIDGLSDEVAFNWVLQHLGIRPNTPQRDWVPTNSDMQDAFASLRKLTERSLICVGRTQYVDGGPPRRKAPYKHVAEDLEVVLSRVEAAVRSARVPADERIDQAVFVARQLEWHFSCWVVNTGQGNLVARQAIDREKDE